MRGVDGDDTPALARALTRLVVLPFRVLRPDPETDFLAFSLPDAIATSLSGIGSLVVRSSATAARFAGRGAGPQGAGRGGRRRPRRDGHAAARRRPAAGRRRSSWRRRAGRCSRRTPCSRRWATSSACRTTSPGAWWRRSRCRSGGETPSPTPDAPHDARAYELYLRANELARTYDQLPQARDLYQRCLELDPSFAPAWAQLGPLPPRDRQVHRRLARTATARAEEAFRRALELNPRLSRGAQVLRAPRGGHRASARAALVRLLGEAGAARQRPRAVRGPRPRLPLLRALRAVHRRARGGAAARPERPHQPRADAPDDGRHRAPARPSSGRRGRGGGDDGIRVIGLGLAGPPRRGARGAASSMRRARAHPALPAVDGLPAGLARPAPRGHARRAWPPLGGLKIMDDPEAIFQEGWLLCDVGEHERGLAVLRRAVAKGYFVAPDPRGQPAVRRAARRSRVPGAAGRGRSGPRSRRWPRSARPAASGSSASVLGGQLPPPRCPARRAEDRRGVKTLARPRDKAEILRRLRALRPDSAAALGTDVGAPDGLPSERRLPHGHGPQAGEPRHRPARSGRSSSGSPCTCPCRWPADGSSPGRRSTSRSRGTRPGDFAADVAQLEALVELFTAPARSFDWQPHPIFGRMSDAEWLRWGYLHMDHHLRQFGAVVRSATVRAMLRRRMAFVLFVVAALAATACGAGVARVVPRRRQGARPGPAGAGGRPARGRGRPAPAARAQRHHLRHQRRRALLSRTSAWPRRTSRCATWPARAPRSGGRRRGRASRPRSGGGWPAQVDELAARLAPPRRRADVPPPSTAAAAGDAAPRARGGRAARPTTARRRAAAVARAASRRAATARAAAPPAVPPARRRARAAAARRGRRAGRPPSRSSRSRRARASISTTS